MSVQITINGDSAADALKELGGLSAGLVGNTGFVAASGPQQGGDTTEVEKPTRRRNSGKAGAEPTETKPAISTGEERNDPAVAQAAEQQKVVEPAKELLTLDSVRNATTAYIEKFGMPAAKVDLTFCLKDATGKDKISDLEGADQATLKKAVDALTAAGEAAKRFEPKSA